MKELSKSLAAGSLGNCYLFYGEEKYLISLYESKMKEFIASAGEASMNIDIFFEKENISNILNTAETMPFFSEKRLIIVKNSGLFSAGRKDDSHAMAEGIKNLPESSILLFIEDNVDKRGVLYKTAVKIGSCIEFKKPTESELITWVVREMKARDIAIDKSSAIHLLRAVSGGMENIYTELLKLAAYCADKQAVSESDIDAICTKGLEMRVFGLVNALVMKDSALALQIFANLMEIKESPIMVLSLIARQFRLILACAEMKGRSSSEIASALGVSPFALKDSMKQAANYKKEELLSAISDCLEADYAIKSGKMGDKLALEILIVKYSSATIVN